MKKVFMCRGCPGSGKSFRARQMAVEFLDRGHTVGICSSDFFFTDYGKKSYDFKKELLGEAHAECRDRFAWFLESEIDVVFVDNTNLTQVECDFYVSMAGGHAYEVQFLEPSTPWAFDIDELEKRNTHGVPRETLALMLSRWVPDMTVEKALAWPEEVTRGEMTLDEKAVTEACLEW